MRNFYVLHMKLFAICTTFLHISMNPLLCPWSFCCKRHLFSVSLNLQVPNTWLWWIWTCDWELCFAQKVAEKNHCNWAWNTFVRCMTFKQMVEVSLNAANMLNLLSSCLLILLASFLSMYHFNIQIIYNFTAVCLVFCFMYQWSFRTTLLPNNGLLCANTTCRIKFLSVI